MTTSRPLVHYGGMNKKIIETEFGDAVEVIDPAHKDFQRTLAEKAGRLASYMLDGAIEAEDEDMGMKATALKAYVNYRTMIQNDTHTLIDKIVAMDDRKLKFLEKALRQRSVIDNMKSGKLELEDIFNLPKKKKK